LVYTIFKRTKIHWKKQVIKELFHLIGTALAGETTLELMQNGLGSDIDGVDRWKKAKKGVVVRSLVLICP